VAATEDEEDTPDGDPDKEFEFIAESPDQANIEVKENGNAIGPF
jgi:hypothetical protein